MHRPIVAPLEPRRYLAVDTLPDFGGLPREVTQVDQTLFFALDSKVDGYLTYVDLVGYNLETGVKTSVKRDKGKAFGQTRYFLSKADDRLLIAEQFGTKYAPEYEVWTYVPGDKRATRLLPGRVKSLPQFMRAGDRVFFTASPAGGTDGIYSVGRSGPATLSYPASAFGVLAGIASFNGGLAAFGGATKKHPQRATTLYVGSGLPGTLKQVKTLPGGIGNFNGFGAGGYLVITGSYKDRTEVYSSIDAGNWTVLSPDADARYTNARVMEPSVSQVILKWSERATDTPRSVRVNLRSGEQFEIATPDAVFRRAGNSLYAYAYEVAPLKDPEAVGGYVAPGGASFIGTGDLFGTTPFLRRIDLRTDIDTQLHNLTVQYPGSSLRNEMRAAGGFVQAGGLTYYIQGDSVSLADNDSTQLWLCSTDGTPAGTIRYGQVAAAPIVWKERVFTLDTTSSTTFVPFAYRKGAIEGRVVIDSRNAKVLTDAMTPLRGRRVFLDTNNNGQYDKPWEPATLTDDAGYYRFDQADAGKQTVRLTPEPGWESTRGWSKTVTVRHGQANIVWFGLKDVARSAVINGYFGSYFSDKTAFLDTNRNGSLDAGERTSDFVLNGGRYRCRFTAVRAGDYQILFYSSEYGVLSGLGTDVVVGAGKTVNVGPRA